MQEKLKKLSFTLIFIFILFFGLTKKAESAVINFSPPNGNIGVNELFQLSLIVDAQQDEIRSTDIRINYDPSFFNVENVLTGNFFPNVVSDYSVPGQIYVAGMVDDPGVSKTGSGEVAKVIFKGKKSGSTSIVLRCNASKIIKADLNATNIISCNNETKTTVNIGGGGGNTGETTGSTNENFQTPTSLPKSGVFENFQRAIIPGVILFLGGLTLKFILKY